MPVHGTPVVSTRDAIIQTILSDLQRIDGTDVAFDSNTNLIRGSHWSEQIYHGTIFRGFKLFPAVQVIESEAEYEDLFADLAIVKLQLSIFFVVKGTNILTLDALRGDLEQAIRKYILSNRKRSNGVTNLGYDTTLSKAVYGPEPLFGEGAIGGLLRAFVIYHESTVIDPP